MTIDDPKNPVHRVTLHKHDFFELCYVIEGQMFQNIEHVRHVYPEGSLCLLNQNIHHSEEFATDFRSVYVSLTPDFLRELTGHSEDFFFENEKAITNTTVYKFFSSNLFGDAISRREYMDFILLPDKNEEQVEMHRRFELLVTQFVAPQVGSTYLIKGILLQILAALVDESKYQTIPVNVGTEFEGAIFDRITELLVQNNGRLSRSRLEEMMNYSGAYLNNIVKKYTGLNLFNYSKTICMKEACRLLRQTDMTISQISDHLQFTNRTHFYKLFRDIYGITPKEYRLAQLQADGEN